MTNCNRCECTMEAGDAFCEDDDGDTICYDCYRELFCRECVICEESYEHPSRSGDSEFLLVAMSSLDECDIDSDLLPPGLYRIEGGPAASLGPFGEPYYNNWHRVGELPPTAPHMFHQCYPIGEVCPECAAKIQSKEPTC